MKKCFIAIAVMMLLGTACISVGPSKIVMATMPGPKGGKMNIIAHSHRGMPDWMLSTSGLKLDYMVRGNVNREQLDAVAEAEQACRIYTDTVRPNTLVAVLVDGVLYAVAGYVGVGLGAKAFPGAVPSQYAKYGALATGTAGLANGIISSGTKSYTFQNCGEDIFSLFPGYDVRITTNGPQY